MATQTFKQLAHRGVIEPGLAKSGGAFDGISTIHKFGYNASITTAQETVWDHGGAYTYLGSAQVLRFTSGSSLDTAGTGPGAWTVEFTGLNSAWNVVTETISLNGHNVVSGAVLFSRINRAIVRSAGSSAQNVGEIFAASGANTDGIPDNQTEIHTTIGSAEGQTLQAFYTVPANTDAYMSHLHLSTAGNATPIFTTDIVAREPGQIFVVKDRLRVNQASQINIDTDYLKFPEKTDIEVRTIADQQTADMSASFDLVLVSSGGGL